MSASETLPAPVLPILPHDKWRQEQSAFRQLLPELLRSHGQQFVAVHDGQVVAAGSDKLAVASQAYAHSGYVPINVGLVTDEPALVVRLPSSRLPMPEPAA